MYLLPGQQLSPHHDLNTEPMTFPLRSSSHKEDMSCWITTSSSKNTIFSRSGNSCCDPQKLDDETIIAKHLDFLSVITQSEGYQK